MNGIEDIRFLQEPLRVSRNRDGDIAKVCVNDVCRVMKRLSFIGNGTAARKCPSAWRLDDLHPRDLYADFGEVVRFVRWIADGSKVLESTGRELLRHLQSSRPSVYPQSGAPSPKGDAGGESIVLEYSGNRFTMRMSDGRYMVNATEMARPFEKRPTTWLKLAETVKLRQALADDGLCRSVEGQVVTTRGPMGATWLEIHLWTAFAQWLSPAFASWCSARLVAMMRGEADPSSAVADERERNDGPPVRTEPLLPLPASYEEALSVIDLQQETIREQNEFLRLNRHKVEHYEATVEAREWFSTTLIAGELGVSAVRLNRFLSDEGVQHRAGDEWVIEPRYRHLRDIHIYEWFNHKTNYLNKYKIDGWTPAGRECILELWKKNNG